MFRKYAMFAFLTIAALIIVPMASPISAQTNTISLNGTVNVVRANIPASNGVIHIIDGVLIAPPPATPGMSATAVATAVATIGRRGGDEGGGEGNNEGGGEGGKLLGTPGPNVADIIAGNPDLSTFAAALKATGLTSVLSREQGTYTVFAPTNEAFAAYLKGQNLTVDNLLADKTKLNQLLTYRVVDKILLGIDLARMTSVTTLNGADITISTNMATVAPTLNAIATASGAN